MIEGVVAVVVILFVFAILFAIFIGIPLCCIIHWDNVKEWQQTKKLKFDTFLNFYNVAPYKWRLDTITVEYKTDTGRTYYSYSLFENFRFSIIDTIRYYLWHKRDIKREKTQKQNEEMAEFLEHIKKDIEEFQAKNEQKVAEDLKEIWRR